MPRNQRDTLNEKGDILARCMLIEQLQERFDVIERRLQKDRADVPFIAWPIVDLPVQLDVTVLEEPEEPLGHRLGAFCTIQDGKCTVANSGNMNFVFTMLGPVEVMPVGERIFLRWLSRDGNKLFYGTSFCFITFDLDDLTATISVDMILFMSKASVVSINKGFLGFCKEVISPVKDLHGYRVLDLNRRRILQWMIAKEHRLDYIISIDDRDIIGMTILGKMVKIHDANNIIKVRGERLSIAKKQLDYRLEEIEFADHHGLKGEPLDLTYVEKVLTENFTVTEVGTRNKDMSKIYEEEHKEGRLYVSKNNSLFCDFDLEMVMVHFDGTFQEQHYRCFATGADNQLERVPLPAVFTKFDFGKIINEDDREIIANESCDFII